MYWVMITVACVCAALLIQYLCSSKLLRMKQAVSIKTMSLRDAREEGHRLEEQETELKSQQTGLVHSVERLRRDIRRLCDELRQKGVEVPEPDFPLDNEGDDAKDAEA